MHSLIFDTLINNLPRIFKILRGKNLFFPIRHSCERQSLGNKNASFTINPRLFSPDNIVYSVGIGNDISFDLQLIEKFGVKVFAFDPTPKSIEWLNRQNLPAGFKAYPIGLAAFTGEADFYLPENENFVSASLVSKQSENIVRVSVKRLNDILKELGHNSIDLLKMDIEGSEYEVIDDIVKSGIKIHQLVIEFHHRFPQHGIRKTREAIKKLSEAGFELFYVSPIGEEFSFINPDFSK
jgi:FkbM family methyltransferase